MHGGQDLSEAHSESTRSMARDLCWVLYLSEAHSELEYSRVSKCKKGTKQYMYSTRSMARDLWRGEVAA